MSLPVPPSGCCLLPDPTDDDVAAIGHGRALTVKCAGACIRVEVTVYRQGLSAQYVTLPNVRLTLRLDAGFVARTTFSKPTNFPSWR